MHIHDPRRTRTRQVYRAPPGASQSRLRNRTARPRSPWCASHLAQIKSRFSNPDAFYPRGIRLRTASSSSTAQTASAPIKTRIAQRKLHRRVITRWGCHHERMGNRQGRWLFMPPAVLNATETFPHSQCQANRRGKIGVERLCARNHPPSSKSQRQAWRNDVDGPICKPGKGR